MALPMITQTELINNICENTGQPKNTVKDVLAALGVEISWAIENCERIRIANMVTIEPKLRKATKKRQGRNPATGEQIMIPAKPASVQVRARISRSLQQSAPSAAKLRRRLAA